MNNDQSNRKNQSFGFFDLAKEQIQRGQTVLSPMMQSTMTTLSSMRQNMPLYYPQAHQQLSSVYSSFSNKFNQYSSAASQHVDQQVQQMGVQATNTARDYVKFKHDPNEFFYTRFQKQIFNYGVDVVADNSVKIFNTAKDFGSNVLGKVPSATWDRFNPMNLSPFATHPDLVKRYFNQRVDQVMQPVHLYRDPKEFAKKKVSQYKNTFWNFKDEYSKLDGGFTGSLYHGARVAVDQVQETAAPWLGVLGTSMLLYNMPGPRAKTNQAMDHMFPKSTMYGKAARFLPTKMMLTKPLARMRGNPLLTAAFLGYSVATSIGKSIKDSQDLAKTSPEKFKRLQSNNTEMYRSSFWKGFEESVQRTRSKSM